MAFPPWGKKSELRTEECEGHSRTPCSGTGRAPGPRPQGRDARAPGPASPGAEGRRAPHGLPRHRARPSSKACPGGPGRGPTGPGASVLCHTVKPACDTAHPGTTLDTRTRVTRTFKNTREERKAPHFATGNGRARGGAPAGWAEGRTLPGPGPRPHRMMSVYSRSLPLLSFHFLYITDASTLAGEKVLGSLRREMTLRRMVLGGGVSGGANAATGATGRAWPPTAVGWRAPGVPALWPLRSESPWGSVWTHPEASTRPEAPPTPDLKHKSDTAWPRHPFLPDTRPSPPEAPAPFLYGQHCTKEAQAGVGPGLQGRRPLRNWAQCGLREE